MSIDEGEVSIESEAMVPKDPLGEGRRENLPAPRSDGSALDGLESRSRTGNLFREYASSLGGKHG